MIKNIRQTNPNNPIAMFLFYSLFLSSLLPLYLFLYYNNYLEELRSPMFFLFFCCFFYVQICMCVGLFCMLFVYVCVYVLFATCFREISNCYCELLCVLISPCELRLPVGTVRSISVLLVYFFNLMFSCFIRI